MRAKERKLAYRTYTRSFACRHQPLHKDPPSPLHLQQTQRLCAATTVATPLRRQRTCIPPNMAILPFSPTFFDDCATIRFIKLSIGLKVKNGKVTMGFSLSAISDAYGSSMLLTKTCCASRAALGGGMISFSPLRTALRYLVAPTAEPQQVLDCSLPRRLTLPTRPFLSTPTCGP